MCDAHYSRLNTMPFGGRQWATWTESEGASCPHLNIAGRSVLQQCFDCADIAAADRKVKGGKTALGSYVRHVPAAEVAAGVNPMDNLAAVADWVS